MKPLKAVLLAVSLLPLGAGAAHLDASLFYYLHGVCTAQPESPAVMSPRQTYLPFSSGSSWPYTAIPAAGLALDEWVLLPQSSMQYGLFPDRSKVSGVLATYKGYNIVVTWQDKPEFNATQNFYLLPSFSWLKYELYYEKNDGYSTHLKDSASPYIYTNDVMIAQCDWTRAGYEFAGWTLTPEGGATTNFPGDVVKKAGEKFGATTNGVVRLYAQWKPVAYDVTFSWQGRRGATNETQKVTHGEKAAAPALAVVDGYTGHTFTGWDGDTNTVITAATAFTAQYDANHYWIVFDANGGSGEMDDEEMVYGEESALSTCMFTRKGCTFLGWALDAEATEPQFAPGASVKNLTSAPDGEARLYAVWKLPETLIPVVFNYRGENAAELSVTNGVSFGTDATPPEDVDGWTGHRFVGWDGDYTNITESVELNALYEPNVYTVRYDANGGDGEMAVQDFLYDEPSALASNAFTHVVADIPWRFLGWAETAHGDAVFADGAIVTNLAVSGTNTLYATWREPDRFTLSVSAGPGGAVEPAGADEYFEGTVVVLTASPDEGHDFTGWNDGVTGNPRSVTVLSNAAYTASFAIRSFEVVFNYRDTDGNAVATTNKVAYGTDATPPAADVVNVWKDHRFTGWEGDYTNVTSSREVTARYEELPPTPPEPELGELAKAADSNIELVTNQVGWCVATDQFTKGDSSVRNNGVGACVLTATVTGPGTITFKWRTNVELADSMDVKFSYMIAGRPETESEDLGNPGYREWSTLSVDVENEGETTLAWSSGMYFSAMGGYDDPSFWIDEIVWTPAGSGPTEKDAPVVGGFGKTADGFALSTETSNASFNYRLLKSATLAPANWQSAGEAISGTGEPLIFEIPFDEGAPQMFYKVEVLAK